MKHKIPFRLLLSLLYIFCTIQLFSLEYGILAKSENSQTITKIFVIAERCSGSHFINSLILENFQVCDAPLGHKHFPPWYDLPGHFYQGNSQYYTFEGTEDFLFIIVFCNPYDWLRSFHLSPWHAHPSLCDVSFSKFIRLPWQLNPSNPIVKEQRTLNSLVDLNPANSLPFENVLHLRTAKIKNMLQIIHYAPHVYYINHETAYNYPQEVLKEIQNLFPITAKPIYKPINTYKGYGFDEYQPKQYDPISRRNLDYINAHLDWEIEEKIGYHLIADPSKID